MSSKRCLHVGMHGFDDQAVVTTVLNKAFTQFPEDIYIHNALTHIGEWPTGSRGRFHAPAWYQVQFLA
jgi:hypothetical protein